MAWHCEKPLLRTSPIPLFLLSRLVRDSGLKVVLTGEGADEIFGGYNIFKEAKVRHYWSRRPQSLRRPRLLERLYPYVFRNPGRERYFLQKFFSVQPGREDGPLLLPSDPLGRGPASAALLLPRCRRRPERV